MRRLLVKFTESRICISASGRMHMQMATMLIVIKGHLRRRFARLLTCSRSPSTLFRSLSPRFSSLAPASPTRPPPVFCTLSVAALPLSQSPRTAEHRRFSPRRANSLRGELASRLRSPGDTRKRPRQRRVNVGLMAPS